MEGFKFANYGQLREVNATEGELDIFFAICAVIEHAGFDSNELELVRKSDSYVTARIGVSDVARFKSTERTQWVMFPYTSKQARKIPIEDFREIQQYERVIVGHYLLAFANKLLYDEE